MKNNKWKELWDKRTADSSKIELGNFEEVFLELKRSNGFDVFSGKVGYESFVYQLERMWEELSFPNRKLDSVFEVGCGSGPNLLYFAKNKNVGNGIGGCDFSSGLIKSAERALNEYGCKELECCEANKIRTDIKYDSVFSMGVFSYFADFDYANEVLKLMLNKTKYSIGILSVHDLDKQEDFINFRKREIENYEERYRDLPKLFYSRNFFLDFAVKNELKIKFTQVPVLGYWNNDFVYNIYFWK